MITNTGDTDGSDDITTASTAGGDVSGAFSALTVEALQGNDISTTAPSNGEVLKWNSVTSEWEPSSDDGETYTAGTGISVAANVITNTGDTDASDDLTTASTAGGDVSGAFASLTVEALQGNDVSATVPSNGEILKWNSVASEWEPSSDVGEVYTAGTGIDLTGNVVTNTGDTDASDDITTASTAGGDVSGAFSALTVEALQGNDVSTTAPSNGEILKWNSVTSEWEPSSDVGEVYAAGTGIDLTGNVVTNTGDTDASDDITTASTAGGDVSGTFAALTVEALQGNDVATTAPADGQVLQWNASASQWEPALDDGEAYTAGTGIDLTGNVVTNTGDTDASDDITSASTAGGDVSGAFSALTVEALQGNDVSATTPNNGEILKWNSVAGEWEPSSDVGEVYTAGTGISLAGNVVTNTGDTDASDDLTTASTAGGDASGAFSALQVIGLRGRDISATAPSNNQVLKWNATANEWQPATDTSLIYSGGTGISVSGTTITNTGDTDASDDLTTASTAGGDASGAFASLTVTALQGNDVASTTPSNGEILKWNSVAGEWEPSSDVGEVYTAGTGISLAGNVVTNTGDTDASDDITTASTAGGDVSGAFSALTVEALQGNDVSATAPNNGEILKWNSVASEWEPSSDVGEVYTAGTGISLAGNVVTNTGDTDASDDLTTASTAGGDATGAFSALEVTGLRGRDISTTAPSNREVLKWNSAANEWQPATDSSNVYTGGTGISVAGTTITNTGDTDASDDITTASTAGGDVSGPFSALTVEALQGNDVSTSAPANQDVLKWNSGTSQWEPSTDNGQAYTAGTGINITGGVVANTGDINAADDITVLSNSGGDVSGTFGAITVEALQGNSVSAAAPATDEILKWDGSAWTPSSDSFNVYTAGTGVDITNGVVTNTGDTDASDDLTTASTAGGDASGAFASLTVEALQGNAVSAAAPATDEILKWDGSAWTPSSDSFNVYTAGTGVDITNGVVTNTGDTDASDDLTTASTAGGDASGAFASLTVEALQGNAVSAAAPATDEILKWDGSAWTPSSDSFNVYTAGTGVDITNGVVTNTGDTDASDDLTTASTAGGDASGAFASLTVEALQGNAVSAAAPATDEILKWDGSAWTPSSDSFNVYTAGTGVDITNGVVTNTGDTDASDDLTTASTAGGDASGAFASLTVEALQGNDVSAAAPDNGEVLTWDGSVWAPDTLTSSNVTFNSSLIPDTDNTYSLGNGTFRYTEVFSAVGLINTSDIRAKENIEDISYGLEELLQIRPVSFEWKDENLPGRKLGLIAQDLQGVMPEVVKTHATVIDPETGEKREEELDRYGVFYSDLIPVLVKGIQEQQSQINSQQTRLEEQEQRLESQQQQLDQQAEMIRLLEERLNKLENNSNE